jgi:hypothetical protein
MAAGIRGASCSESHAPTLFTEPAPALGCALSIDELRFGA